MPVAPPAPHDVLGNHHRRAQPEEQRNRRQLASSSAGSGSERAHRRKSYHTNTFEPVGASGYSCPPTEAAAPVYPIGHGLEVTSAIVAYVSTVDNATNDPSYQEAFRFAY